MRMPRPRHTSTWAAIGVYVLLLAASIFEQFGRTTNDSKTSLVESPGETLGSTFSLWNPLVSLGELQNQAYGFLFPQGPFFLVGELADIPPWLTERLWSTLLLVVGCEGARRVASAIGLPPWAAWAAGMAYGLNPRVISQVAVRSGEILPGVMTPWVLLPVVLAVTGRLGARSAALLSVAAFMFSGAANGTATLAPLPIVVIVMVWGIRRGHASWSLLAWWSGLLVLSSVWWTASLLKLSAYSPPFFDYVEDADVTTSTTGFSASLRGASNWVNYVTTGSYPVWPAGFEFAFTPWLIVASGALAAVGIIGLVTWRSPWRHPLILSAALAMGCLTIGHASDVGSPLALPVRDLLDGPFALLRNVHKVDPVLRLPVAVGVGAAVAAVLQRVSSAKPRSHLRRRASVIALAGLVGLTLVPAQPALAFNLRTPGWERIPDYWQETADYLDEAPGRATAWVIPGSGFGVQTWGWTLDEPMSAVATTPWVARSQVPLVPAETIRALQRLEDFLASGTGSPYLGRTLARLGLTHVVVRNDLEPTLAEATSSNLVTIAMARSVGVSRVEQFGTLDFGPAVEVYTVDEAATGSVAVRDADTAVTIGGTSEDVVDAVGRGLVGADQAAVVRGDSGWDRPADVIGDAYRLRERSFARVHDSVGPPLAPDEPLHGTRAVRDYPANPGAEAAVARYSGIKYVDASSSLGFVDGLGGVRPENAPFAAVDGDLISGWRTGYFIEPVGEWLEVVLDAPRRLRTLEIRSGVLSSSLNEVLRWRVQAGNSSQVVDVDPWTGVARVDLNVRAATVRLTVDKVRDPGSLAPISVQEVRFAGLPAERTLVLPQVDAVDDVDFILSARPEVRSCISTLLAPDCRPDRGRQSEESLGIDRIIDVPADGRWSLSGTVVARARPATARLLDPIGGPVVVRPSSILSADPTVSGRATYDGDGATSWIADPFDPAPTLVLDFATPRRISRIGVLQPAQPAVTPTVAVLRSESGTRRVELGDFGVFEPLRVKHLEIEFSNSTRGRSPIGVAELYLGPKGVTVPFDGSAATGAACGFGPTVEIDGTQYPTRVEGFMGNVVSAGPLDLTVCASDTGSTAFIPLTAGEHHVRVLSSDEFQPVIVEMRAGRPPSRRDVDPREFSLVEDEATHQRGVIGPGDDSLLTTTRNFNAGWTARLDGQPLPVQRIDGWAQGWRVPAGDGGVVEIEFAPQPSYLRWLIGGMVLAGMVLLAALVAVFRIRLGPSTPLPETPTRDPRRRRSRLTWLLIGAGGLAALGVGWLLGGLAGLVGVGVSATAVHSGARKLLVVSAAALMLAGPVWVAVALEVDGQAPGWGPDMLAGVGFVFACVLGLSHRTGRLAEPAT